MTEVGILEAKTHLSRLIEQVEKGEEVVITRHGKPVARLVRPLPRKEGTDIERLRQAFAKVDALGDVEELRGVSAVELVHAGRRYQD
ncbi:MAG TPA: type II toxin-antitoxin system prevent-host-death family antitoxin [Geminicoccus sp.]|uniref:type II toxin-antitoxin system Phd/YefM family antitoxin n=1 Tax=Geminicoccus sp. TaxID=2024832 RepID=UPI002D00CFCA|nr:type II toxin-antitoxin system prevent-host-death family antitoxin [Geminicoccus sp.]HWL70453.1 type II toxin-antitoxin system prevent-host-death family antitoxin [Geminicoccus sp.]